VVKAAKDFAGHLQLTIGLLNEGTFLFTKNLRWSAMACAYAKPLAEVERSYILQVLRDCYGNRTRAAKLLGISIRGLRIKLSGYAKEGFLVPAPSGSSGDHLV
jgi:Bacterial regulatory protein, Fis family